MRISYVFIILILASDLFAQQEQFGLPDTLNQLPIYTRPDSISRLVYINRVFIVGNRITRDQIVLRELTLRQGDVINSLDLPAILERDKKKLINTRLFNTVEIRPLELQEGHIDLLIDLDERWYTFPAPIFELSDRNFNEWWETYDHDFSRVNYGLRLYQFNMRGRNETLRLTAQFGFQRRFELSYRFPYIDKKQKHGLIIDADFTETKNLAFRTVDHKLEYLQADDILRTTRGGGITYTYRNSFYVSHALKIEYRSNNINDTIPSLNSNYYSNDKYIYWNRTYCCIPVVQRRSLAAGNLKEALRKMMVHGGPCLLSGGLLRCSSPFRPRWRGFRNAGNAPFTRELFGDGGEPRSPDAIVLEAQMLESIMVSAAAGALLRDRRHGPIHAACRRPRLSAWETPKADPRRPR